MRKPMIRRVLLPVISLILLVAAGCGKEEKVLKSESNNNFYNMIMQDGADPWAYRHTDGYYYFTKTTAVNVTLWKSEDLTTLDAGSKLEIPTGGHNIWAPELHYLNGAWYIYYAMDDGDNMNHRMYVMENTSADPMKGQWEKKGQITDESNRFAIDGTVLAVEGELYFIWSGLEAEVNDRQNLYIAHMSNPWTIDSERVEIARPTHSWETNHSPEINEGPQVIIKNGIINLVYSASGSWTNHYCLGLITAELGSDLLDAASWEKRDEPIFQSANGILAPGHHSFTTSPDGTEDWIVYHSAKFNNSGWNREVRAQKFTWNEDNTPQLGDPVDPNQPIALPAGEPERIRYEAEKGTFGGGAASLESRSGSQGYKAGEFKESDSYVEFNVRAESDGEYILLARTANGTIEMITSHFLLSVNGASPSNLYVVLKGWENWGLSTARISLKAGDNTIRFTKGVGEAELDFFDLRPVSLPVNN